MSTDFFGGTLDAAAVAMNMKVSAEKLLKAGARLLFVPGMFDLSRLPKNAPGISRPDDATLAQATMEFNAILQKNLEDLRKAWPAARIISADPETMVQRITEWRRGRNCGRKHTAFRLSRRARDSLKRLSE